MFEYDFSDEFFLEEDHYIRIYHSEGHTYCRIAIGDTHPMNQVMDSFRSSMGHLPMFPDDDSEPYDSDGWYNFYVVLDRFKPGEYAVSLEVTVVSDEAEDNEQTYAFALPSDVQNTVFDRLDILCEEYIGDNISQLIYDWEHNEY